MTDSEKNISIEYILAQGFVKPPTLRERVTKMHNVLGWRFIFWDLSYSIIFVMATVFAIAILFRNVSIVYIRNSVAVAFSPMLFVLITLLAEVNERACGLFELKQTCRYTSRQITALRCIYYSLAGVAFSVFITAFSSENATDFFRILPLCLGVLFLCATMELSIIRLSRSKWAVIGFSAIWLFISLALPFALGQRWEVFITRLPLVFTIIFMIAGAVVFMCQTTKMLTEEKNYAIA